MEHICKQCQLDMNPIDSSLLICSHCGYFEPKLEADLDKKSVKTVAMTFLLLGAFISLSLWHYSRWNDRFFSVIPLQIKTLTNLAERADLQKYSEFCLEQMNYACAEETMLALALPGLIFEDQIRIASLKRKLKKYAEAEHFYRKALEISNKNQYSENQKADAYFGLARSLAFSQRVDEAIKYYDRAIQAKPDVIQITVTQDYVEFLKKLGRQDKAKKVIAEARRRGNSESLFAGLL